MAVSLRLQGYQALQINLLVVGDEYLIMNTEGAARHSSLRTD